MPLTSELLIVAALVIIASLSPAHTFAALWQIKEWRIDRLREHIRSEGLFRQTLGIIRPTIVALGCIVAATRIVEPRLAAQSVLWILAGMATLQFQLKRQPRPVPTQKAKILLASSTSLTALLTLLLLQSGWSVSWLLLLVIPLLQPVIMLIAWAQFLPVDRHFKRRILDQARALRSTLPDLIVIGVTGSVGKTTTKELLAHVLKAKGAIATPAHVNSEIGVSQWFIKTFTGLQDKTPPILVAEMGAYRKGEIALLCSVLQPTIGMISFIGTQHIALFGSQDALIDAKGELLQALPESGRAFLNADSPFIERLQEKCPCPFTTVGTSRADLRAEDVEETSGGLRFRLGETNITVPLHGTHNATNVLLAIAAAEHLGMRRADIAAALKTFSPPDHTFTVREEQGITILDDTHNASPASFAAAIEWAKTQPGTPKILLTPGLIEQGDEQDRVHAELGAASASVFDRAIFLHHKSATTFGKGYGKPVEYLTGETSKVAAGSLLVCIGRMSPRAIHLLLS